MGIEALAALVAQQKGNCHYRAKALFDHCPILNKEPDWRDCAECHAYIPHQQPRPRKERKWQSQKAKG